MNFLTLLVLGQAIVPNVYVAPGSTSTQSTATQTLYVSTTGNNNNPCTSSGAACLTVDGALNKLPNTLRHNATISVAAGAYAAPLTITRKDLTIVGGVTLSVTGTMSTPTLTTGTTSGTTTASSAGSSSGPGTVTDSGQSWTVDELKSKFIRFTSGTYNGQSWPISSNTATVITIPAVTAAGTGVTYVIEDIGSTFVSSSAINWNGMMGSGALTVSNVRAERTGSGSGPTINMGVFVTLLNVFGKGATGNGVFSSSGNVTCTRSIFEGANGGFFVASQSSSTGPAFSRVAGANSIWRGTTGSGVTTGVGVAGSITPGIFEVTTGVGILNSGVQNGQSPSVWVTCSSTGTGIQLGATISNSAPHSYVTQSMNGGVRITGCSIGIASIGYAATLANAPAFSSVTTAFSATRGGTIDLNGTTPTFSSVTNEFSIDGTVYTLANLDALAAPKIYTNNYGSRIIR